MPCMVSLNACPMDADSDNWHTKPTEEETLLFPLQFDFSTGHDLSLAEAPKVSFVSRQKFCRDKHVFCYNLLFRQKYACRDKIMFGYNRLSGKLY